MGKRKSRVRASARKSPVHPKHTAEDPSPTPEAKKAKGPSSVTSSVTESIIGDQSSSQKIQSTEKAMHNLGLRTILLTFSKPAVVEERNGEIEYQVVTNDGSRESTVILTGLKCLFQLQLPQMPPAYIARLVFDRSHLSMAIVRKPLEVIGGITYREFRERKFAEIVFCAISPSHQVKGYGAHMMAHLKDYVRSSSPVMTFLTYADNYATGYFQKQGFTKDITLDNSIWMGMIKDYQGVTLMQCTMLPRIRYLEVDRMLALQKASVQAKIRTFNKNHIIHQPPQQWANGVVPIDPLSIPAIKESGWSPEMDELSRQPHRGTRYYQLLQFLNQIQNNKHAWPFLKPVNKRDVPDYYDVVSNPMDLAKIEKRINVDEDYLPKDLIHDLKLIFSNCYLYNAQDTPYTKCAILLERHMWRVVKQIPEWHGLIEK